MGLRVWGLGLGLMGLKVWDLGLGHGAWVKGLRVWGLGFGFNKRRLKEGLGFQRFRPGVRVSIFWLVFTLWG